MLKKLLFTFVLLPVLFFRSFSQQEELIDFKSFHLISSHDLLDYAAELSSGKYEGRLSGSPGYENAARWIAGKLKEWGLKPVPGDSGFFHWFPNPYTKVINPGSVVILPGKGEKGEKKKKLAFPQEYYPGSNAASGKVSGEVVYAGFGISAPGLKYDDYENIDVKSKIVLIEPGVPYTGNDSLLLPWEPYSYHRYKFQRARELGAAGLLYVGLTANPNTSWLEGFVYAHISEPVADILLQGTGRKYAELKPAITSKMLPVSFAVHKRVTITAETIHFPGSFSCNVAGIIEGSDPELKNEAIIIGAHLDAVGSPGMLFPGALDNASGCSDLLGAAHAMATSAIKPARTVIFVFFGGEECGLYGSKYSVQDPLWPFEKVKFMINLDMVGNGTGFHLSGGLSYPEIYRHFKESNEKYIHRELSSSETRISYGRPRTDGAIFEKAGYKTLGLWTTGTVKPVFYHQPLDNTDGLTPEIMEDAAKLLYLGILNAANDGEL